jgi:hypothetical protein
LQRDTLVEKGRSVNPRGSAGPAGQPGFAIRAMVMGAADHVAKVVILWKRFILQ